MIKNFHQGFTHRKFSHFLVKPTILLIEIWSKIIKIFPIWYEGIKCKGLLFPISTKYRYSSTEVEEVQRFWGCFKSFHIFQYFFKHDKSNLLIYLNHFFAISFMSFIVSVETLFSVCVVKDQFTQKIEKIVVRPSRSSTRA